MDRSEIVRQGYKRDSRGEYVFSPNYTYPSIIYLPAMKASTMSRASESEYWIGGDFIKYDDGAISAPPIPLSRANLQHLSASMTIPAEFGESQTSSLRSRFNGTSPKAVPLMLI